jgi:hypothetical protein
MHLFFLILWAQPDLECQVIVAATQAKAPEQSRKNAAAGVYQKVLIIKAKSSLLSRLQPATDRQWQKSALRARVYHSTESHRKRRFQPG